MTAAAAPRRGLLVATFTLVAVFSLFADLGRQDAINVNEIQRLEPPVEMAERGDWVVPTLDDKLYLAKPPLVYWMIGAAYAVGGRNPLAARIPIALAVLLAAGLLAWMGRREEGGNAGWWAAILLLSAYYVRERSQEAELDPVLMTAVLGMVYAQWRALRTPRWLGPALIGGAASGAAWLLKGPVVVPFLVTAAVVAAGTERPPWRRWLASTAVVLGLGAAIILPWALAVIHRLGWETVWSTLQIESLSRFSTASRINSGPVWFYVPQLALGFLPWTWLIGFWLSRDYRGRRRERGSAFIPFAGLFAAATVVVFSLMKGKETEYLLPLFPFLALLGGSVLEWMTRSPARAARWGAAAGLGAWAVLALVSPVEFASPLGEWLSPFREPGLLLLPAAWAGAAAVLFLIRGRRTEAAAAVALGVTLAVFTAQGALKIRANVLKSGAPLVAPLREAAEAGTPAYRYEMDLRGLYYVRPWTRPLDPEAPRPAPGDRGGFVVATREVAADTLLARLGDPVETAPREEAARGIFLLLHLRLP